MKAQHLSNPIFLLALKLNIMNICMHKAIIQLTRLNLSCLAEVDPSCVAEVDSS